MIKSRLAVLLAERNIKVGQASEDTGIARNTITSLTTDSSAGVQFDTINKLCKYLKCTPADFFEYSPIDIKTSLKIKKLSLEDEKANKGKLNLEFEGLITYSVDFGDRLVTYYNSAGITSLMLSDYEPELDAINNALPKNKKVDYLINVYFDDLDEKQEFKNDVFNQLTIGFQNMFFEELKKVVMEKLATAISDVASLTGAQHLLDREIKFCIITDYNQMYSSLKFKFA
ncbi:helix-turn-helix transcriptional regulator [Listeria grandensis]|uniref:Helix-turn-helix transcriptional regulator n=2 Tax=Listeria TaxID=1637 RepID=A0A7X0Y1G6_9LIST|nr:helix-turn-helix transcriptional regulator [Listeria grandensis]MBC1935114.1 helix-turn-helix transcriptional regulator [Listeria grandensis]